jgi:hypothetical protein
VAAARPTGPKRTAIDSHHAYGQTAEWITPEQWQTAG